MAVTFYDETGVNPLPAGIKVTVLAGSIVIGQGWTLAGGVAVIPLGASGSFLATFFGTQAPQGSAVVATDANGNAIVIVNGYRSPSLSVLGYAIEETNLWPTGWFSDVARTTGGNAYAVAIGLAGVLNFLDQQGQTLLAMERLQSCSASDIDTWAFDFFGPEWTRFVGQTDASWYAMILAILQIPKTTCGGIQAIINVFWPWIALQLGTANFAEDTGYGGEDTNQGGEDVSNNIIAPAASQALGDDTHGGEDTTTGFEDSPAPTVLPPNAIVFDSQTNPALSSLITPNIVTTQFGVYLQYPSFSDTLIHPVLAQSTLLDYIVRAWKAAGTVPIYAQNR